MQKLGKILLLILNIFIDIFLVSVVCFLLLWLILGITPEQSLQKSMVWITSFVGGESQEKTDKLSKKYQQRAHRNLYVQELNKKDESGNERISQPYKYE